MTISRVSYDDVVNEIDTMVRMRSNYIVSFIEALQFEDQLWVSALRHCVKLFWCAQTIMFQVVMECCDGGAICDVIRATRSTLNEEQAKEVVTFVLLALEHIHKNLFIHRVSIGSCR